MLETLNYETLNGYSTEYAVYMKNGIMENKSVSLIFPYACP
jgi:hypothetical protein